MAFSEAMAQWAEQQICARFERQFGYPLPLQTPTTLREKLFARMVLLHRHNSKRFGMLTDKLNVRRYVEQCIGSANLTTIAWAGEDPESAPLEVYSRNWEPLELSCRGSQQARYQCKKPDNLSMMLKLAESLAAPFGFVRVDLYNLKGAITFSELTFTPLAGDLWLEPADWDQELGNCWPNDALI